MKQMILSLIAIVAGLVNSAVHGSDEPAADWFVDSDAVELAHRDIDAGNWRLFEYCGFSCDLPAVGIVHYMRCLQSIPTERIGPVGDALSGDEIKLATQARKYAAGYNEIMRQEIESMGWTACAPGEDWSKTFDLLSDYMESLPAEREGQESRTHACWIDAVDGCQFGMQLSENNWKEEVYSGFCNVIAESGIKRMVRVRLEAYRTGEPERHAMMTCAGGKVADFEWSNAGNDRHED